MTAVEMRLSLLQEVATILDDETMVKKALASLRRIKQNATTKPTSPVSKPSDNDNDHEPTKEEILADIREGLLEIKKRREGKETTGMFRNITELLNEKV